MRSEYYTAFMEDPEDVKMRLVMTENGRQLALIEARSWRDLFVAACLSHGELTITPVAMALARDYDVDRDYNVRTDSAQYRAKSKEGR